MLPHVTVIIPCFNRADTVEQAVRSVLEQNYPAFDVVAVDDGSEDETLEVLSRIEDRRFRVIENPGPKGVSGARNAGAAAAKGDWIGFQDSDDLWRPNKLLQQMAKVASGDWVAVYCAMEVVEGDGSTTWRVGRVPDKSAEFKEGDIRQGLALTSLVSTQTVIIRRDIFEKQGGFDTDFEALVDWELMLRVAEHGSIAFVDEELVEQRMSANSITHSNEKRLIAQEQVLVKHGGLLSRYPRALAKHHYRIAGAHRQLRKFESALYHLRMARKIMPFVPKYHLLLNYVVLRKFFAQRN